MLKYASLGLFCLCFSLTLGCGPGAPSAPSQEEIDKNNAAMSADMKKMTLPKNPK